MPRRWLKGAAALPEPVARVRAQAQVALVDLMPDGLTRRVEAADRLALTGARRSMLTDWGVLFTDAGKLDDARSDRLRQLLIHLPGARTDLALLYVGGDRGAKLRARGQVAYVAGSTEKFPFGEEAPAGYDPAVSAIAHDLAVVAVKRVLEAKPELRAQCERDATAASGDAARLLGKPRAPSVEHVLGAALHALLVDGPRSVDLAFTRLSGGQPETAALLSDALGVLAQDARTATPPKTEIGKGAAWLPITALKLAPNGVATNFTFDGRAYRRDAAAVKPPERGAAAPAAPGTAATKK